MQQELVRKYIQQYYAPEDWKRAYRYLYSLESGIPTYDLGALGQSGAMDERTAIWAFSGRKRHDPENDYISDWVGGGGVFPETGRGRAVGFDPATGRFLHEDQRKWLQDRNRLRIDHSRKTYAGGAIPGHFAAGGFVPGSNSFGQIYSP